MEISTRPQVCITGAAGFIGAALANFLSKDFVVKGIDNLSTGNWNRCNPSVVKYNLDISQASKNELNEIMMGSKFVFHLAAVKLHNKLNSEDIITRVNKEGSLRVFQSAVESGVEKTIFTSSLYAYGSMGPNSMKESDPLLPINSYGESKVFGENLIASIATNSHMKFAIARLFFIYGPFQYSTGGYKSVIVRNFENSITGLPLEVKGTGEQSLDYLYIDDCVHILSNLANSSFQGVINVSSGLPIKINKIIHLISELTGNYRLNKLDSDWTEGSIRFGSTDRREKILGQIHLQSIEKGLENTWNWMIKNNMN